MTRNDENDFPVLSLEAVVLEGGKHRESWEPLSLGIRKGSVHSLSLTREEALALIRVIKGIAVPAEGRVFKKGRDTTGWIQPDGIIALYETGRFFFPTVRDELAFASRVGQAKGIPAVSSFQEEVLDIAGLGEWMTSSPLQLERSRQGLLALTAALLMAPDLLILLDPMKTGREASRDRYFRLLTTARQRLDMALLYLSPNATPPFAGTGSDSFPSTPSAGGR